jgi:hypothetical protein
MVVKFSEDRESLGGAVVVKVEEAHLLPGSVLDTN